MNPFRIDNMGIAINYSFCLLFFLTFGVLFGQEDGEYRVICVYGSWVSAYYGSESNKFTPEHLDTKLCTDILYDGAQINKHSDKISPGNSRIDVKQGYYNEVLSLKESNPSLRVHLLLGGWANSKGARFSNMVSDPDKRQSFISSTISFLKKYGFDGVNVAWMFPVCWQAKCSEGPSSDRTNFQTFMQELRVQMEVEAPELTLSVVVSGDMDIALRAYDIPLLERTVDFIYVMTYDLNGPWNKKAGPHAPLYIEKGTDMRPWSVSDCIYLWLDNGVPSKKIIMGIPFYGVGFTLRPEEHRQIGARSIGKSNSSEVFRNSERMAYFEICSKVSQEKWTKVDDSSMGPYAYNQDQWVGYDDVSSVVRKAEFVKELNLGGVSLWEVSMDDFKAVCCRVRNPLLNVASFVLRGIGEDPQENLACEPTTVVGPLF